MTSAGGVPKKTSNKQIDGTMEGIKYIHLCEEDAYAMWDESPRGARYVCGRGVDVFNTSVSDHEQTNSTGGWCIM